MLDHNAPTVPMPAQAPVPPPTFPQSRIEVVEQGVVFVVAFTPTLQLSQFVDDETMTAIDKRRLELKKQTRNTLAAMHDIKRSNTPH